MPYKMPLYIMHYKGKESVERHLRHDIQKIKKSLWLFTSQFWLLPLYQFWVDIAHIWLCNSEFISRNSAVNISELIVFFSEEFISCNSDILSQNWKFITKFWLYFSQFWVNIATLWLFLSDYIIYNIMDQINPVCIMKCIFPSRNVLVHSISY